MAGKIKLSMELLNQTEADARKGNAQFKLYSGGGVE